MEGRISFGKLENHLTASATDWKGTPAPDTPFRVLIIGEFSNRSSGNRADPSDFFGWRAPLFIDRDNLGEVMAKLGPELRLRLSGSVTHPLVLRFAGVEDFHPDRLFSRLEIFQALRKTRQRLLDVSTFHVAAEEVKQWLSGVRPRTAATVDERAEEELHASNADRVSADFLLDGSRKRETSILANSEWETMLEELVKPYVLPKEDPRQAELVAMVDAVTSGLMRKVLHHAEFQALEAAWRSLDFLVRRVETDTHLQLFLLDISREELASDLLSSDNLKSCQLYKILIEQTLEVPGAEPWAAIVGNYTFDAVPEDVQVLGRVAKLSCLAGAPFLAGASPTILECRSLAENPDPEDWNESSEEGRELWRALRRQPESSCLGLAMPRFLLRLPYGGKSDPIDHFDFEEMKEDFEHESYLWANPAFVGAYLLAQMFSHSGWDFTAGELLEVKGLPLHIYQCEGESCLKPCAEVLLTKRAAEVILDQGIMPLLSMKGHDSIRLGRFQSLAEPCVPLEGAWDRA